MRKTPIALAIACLLLFAGTALSHHIGTRFSVSTDGCRVAFIATSSESHEDGAWIAIPSALIDRSMSLDAMVMRAVRRGAVHDDYDIGRTPIRFGPYTLAAGSYVLLWDQEPLGSWETSHDELPFSVACSTPTPRPTPKPTPPPSGHPSQGATPTPDSGGGKDYVPTPPPTDTVAELPPPPSVPALPLIALVLGILAGIVLLLTPRRVR
jgi:hypothetical protein